MPAIPLPFIVALLLAILLLRLVLLREPALRPAVRFVGACLIVAATVGARWTFDLQILRFVQPILAAALPPFAWLSFTVGDPKHRWLHLIPVLAVTVLCAFWQVWRFPVDLILALIYIAYGLALLRLARCGPDGFAAARLSDAAGAQKAALLASMLLIASAVVDLFIAIDFGVYRGGHAEVIVMAGNLLVLPVLAYAVAVIGGSTPADAEADRTVGEPAGPQTVTTEDDERIIEIVERLLHEKQLFRDPDLSLNRIARRTGIPARQISVAVNRLQRRSVSQLVNSHRIDAAKRLLAETDMPVTTVMFEAGFQTKSNFNREFLRMTGRSPSDFRRSVSAA